MPADPSLDNFVRPLQQGRRNRQAEGLGGLEVDDQLESRGLLDWQLARLRASENLVRIDGTAAEEIVVVRAVAHQATRLYVVPHREHRWQPVLGGPLGQALSFGAVNSQGEHQNALRLRASHGREGAFQVCPGPRYYRL